MHTPSPLCILFVLVSTSSARPLTLNSWSGSTRHLVLVSKYPHFSVDEELEAMLLLILLVFFAQNATGDELISARCQSKCLHDMEFRYQVGLKSQLSLFGYLSLASPSGVYDSISCAYEYSGNMGPLS